MPPRSFASAPAERRPEPVLIGVSGPSSSGKTKTMLRLATGLVSVSGGPIYFIDTEGGRAAKYAPPPGKTAQPPHSFAFEHVLFEPPFNPLSYRDAIQHCEAKGAGAIIVDSMSHEHAGEGGRIDSAEQEAQKRAAKWGGSPDKYKFAGFAPNSAERQALLYHLGKRKCHILLGFRAKETSAQEGKTIIDEGFTPIGCDAFVFELDSSLLLYPRAAGVPTWRTDKRGELLAMKLDDIHAGILDDGEQLTERHGQRLAAAAGFNRAGADRQPPQRTPDAPCAIPLASDADGETLKRWGADLRALIAGAPTDGLKITWAEINADALLRVAARSPKLATWIREPLPPSADQDADDPELGADAVRESVRSGSSAAAGDAP